MRSILSKYYIICLYYSCVTTHHVYPSFVKQPAYIIKLMTVFPDYLNRLIFFVSFKYFINMAITGAEINPINPNNLRPAYIAVIVIMG